VTPPERLLTEVENWRNRPSAEVQVTELEPVKLSCDTDRQHLPNCCIGAQKVIAAIIERPVIRKILTYLGLDPQPPARGGTREAGQDFPA
jgi:hypothetical protein